MPEQHFGNHSRIVPLFHYVTLPLATIGLFGAVWNLIHHWSDPHMHIMAALLLVLYIVVALLAWFVRIFALKAQNRAIRAEEALRHFILTGKPADPRLKLGQIIALRFASDEEYLSLAKRAVEENLSQKEIKQAIRHWRADWHRV